MKRITLLSAALLFAFGMNAQTVIFEDDFEAYSADPNVGAGSELPPDYTSYDVNQNGYQWGLSNTGDWTQDMTPIYDGNFMISVSYLTGDNVPVEADAILVLPMISIPGGAESADLEYYIGSGTDPDFYSETYDVIVTTESDEASILAATPVFSETLPQQGGDVRNVNLDDFIGEDIYISFYHRDTEDEWVLGLDNIVVTAEGVVSTTDFAIPGFSHFYAIQTQTLHLSAENAFESISLYNMLGEEVVAQKLSSNNEEISLANLKDGVYIANVVAGGQAATVKIVKR